MSSKVKLEDIHQLKDSLGITSKHIEQARDWVKDCMGGWRDLDSDEDVDDMSDNQILLGVQKHYNGGLAQFVKDTTD